MDGYLISVDKNTLRITLAGTKETAEQELSDGASHEVIAEGIGKLLLEKFSANNQKLPLTFLVGPDEVILNFLTVHKNGNGSTSEEALFELAKKKLLEQKIVIEDLHFSFQKIAPFVYQFIGIKKQLLDQYLEIATDLGLELKAVVPWVLALPRAVEEARGPAIFVLDSSGKKVLALSELGGIYYLGALDDSNNLEGLVKKLSVYQRDEPITQIYTFGVDKVSLDEKYRVDQLPVQTPEEAVTKVFEDSREFSSQLNMLTLLPLPEVTKPKVPMVYVGAVLAAFLVAGGFVGIWELSRRGIFTPNTDAQTAGGVNVLSDAKESSESTPTVQEDAEQVEEEQSETDEVALNKEYLRIRIENGTSVGGLAGRTRDYLAPFGYEILPVVDAEESDREITLVRFSPDNLLYKDILLPDLEGFFESVEVTEDLAEDVDYDVLIIAGSNEISQ